MIILGLTGSIGMGKSATAEMFRRAGVPVYDADAAVHRLYAGPAVEAVEAAFPGSTENGRVDRKRLGARVLGDAQALRRLEAIVHPLVRAEEERFLQLARARGAPLVVLDIPLLFETAGDRRCDVVAVVSTTPEIQRDRVLQRPGMTPQTLEAILAKQMPDAEKRRKAHHVIDTGRGFPAAERQVAGLIRALVGRGFASTERRPDAGDRPRH